MNPPRRFHYFCVWPILIVLSTSSAADRQIKTGKLNEAEKWVVAQIIAGEVADLRQKFSNQTDRKLGAHFLQELLTGALGDVHRNGVRIMWAMIDEPIDLRNARIACEVWLEHCHFTNAVNFGRASFGGLISFQNTRFDAEANFAQMRVGDGALFQHAVFNGPVDFSRTNITSAFAADETQFRNNEKEATFQKIKVGDVAFFRKAVFEGGVDFSGADIASSFIVDEARFDHKDEEVNFYSLKVGRSASFRKVVFEGPVDFTEADITSNFVADEAWFKQKEKGANFNTIRVGRVASFQKAVFEGPVDFVGADVTSNFMADYAKFESKTETVQLSMQCGRSGFFRDVTFAGPASFAHSSFVDLIIENIKPNAAPLSQLDVSRSSIKGELRIRHLRITDLRAPYLHVEGPTTLSDTTIIASADLSYGDFVTLDLSRLVWPNSAAKFQLQGMNYKHARAAKKEPESHRALLELVGQSAYTADVYSDLEAFFLRQGYRDDADHVFIEGKRRERKQLPYGLQRIGSWLLDRLVGYGRYPSNAGYLCFFFVGLGFFLFSGKKMEPQKKDDAPRVYNRFWYGLSLFLPFVDLQAHKVWKPKPDQTFLRNYMRVHILLGWILIPIVLAALAGLIK